MPLEISRLVEVTCGGTRQGADGRLAFCTHPVTHRTPKGTFLCAQCAVRWMHSEQREVDERRELTTNKA